MKKHRGRTPCDDEPWLKEMALRLARGEAKSIREAARLVAGNADGASLPSKEDRLRNKYGKRGEELKAWATKQLEPKAPVPAPRRRPPSSTPKCEGVASAAAASMAESWERSVAASRSLESDAARATLDAYYNSAVGATLRWLEERRRMEEPFRHLSGSRPFGR